MEPSPPAEMRRIRAVVIDDREEQREMLEFMLLARGFDVAGTANDGEEGLFLIREVQPDVVISDYQMPRLDGLGLVRALRNDARSEHLPVLIVTGTTEDGVAQLRDISDVAVVAKPVGVTELVDAVDSLLVNASREDEIHLVGRRVERN